MAAFLSHLKKWWLTELPILAGLFFALAPSAQTWASQHGYALVASLLGLIILAHNSTAPKDSGAIRPAQPLN